MTTFETFMGWLLPEEGGYVNDPHDPGGETNWGIAKRYHPDVDIRNLTREGAITIYHTEYWLPLECEQLPPAIAFMVADAGINEGALTAVELLQKALGVGDDGIIGPVTLSAAKAADPTKLLLEIAARRMVRYAEDPNALSFELGWARRLMSCVHAASALLVS